jgi:hypothetical protein
MNLYLAAAGVLASLVSLVHSVLGERLIFSRMRLKGLVPTNGGQLIGEGHVRILWASWHVVTVLGWLVAVALLGLAVQPLPVPAQAFLLAALVVAMSICALLVFVGTQARHPGWVGLLGVAVLTWLGRGNG